MKTENLALVRGWADTRETLHRWRRRPAQPLLPWSLGSVAVAALLLSVTWGVAILPGPHGRLLPRAHLARHRRGLRLRALSQRLVLALHGLACVAGFMAGSSLPQVAAGYSGLWRRVHEKAGPLAIGFVICATLFSLTTQAYALGHQASTLAAGLDMPPALLLLGLAPHALPELFALFLPLAAWTLASRRGAWNELLAATFVTVAIAIPILIGAAAIEVWVSPRVLLALAG